MSEWDLKITVVNGQWRSHTFKAEGPLDALRISEEFTRRLLTDFDLSIASIELVRR